jgi:hypothetical protein
VQKALRLLELLGLVEISTCYAQETRRQTSNLYTLLTPPDQLPEIDPDPRKWTRPQRRTVLVRGSNRSEAVTAARPGQRGLTGEQPVGDSLIRVSKAATPRNGCTLPAAPDAPLEGNTREGTTRKERSHETNDRETARRPDGKEDDLHVQADRPSRSSATFVLPEVGLTNRQVWAATLGELARRGEIGRTELESWLRPAALIGRDGETPPSGRVPAERVGPEGLRLVIGAPNAVSRERIATRLLPAVREALAATIGVPVEVSVVVTASG